MRKNIDVQMTIWDVIPEHSMGQELKVISDLLDRHPRFREWVAADLHKHGTKNTGRNGLSVDSIMRAAIIK